jgi:hypothetical protein
MWVVVSTRIFNEYSICFLLCGYFVRYQSKWRRDIILKPLRMCIYTNFWNLGAILGAGRVTWNGGWVLWIARVKDIKKQLCSYIVIITSWTRFWVSCLYFQGNVFFEILRKILLDLENRPTFCNSLTDIFTK